MAFFTPRSGKRFSATFIANSGGTKRPLDFLWEEEAEAEEEPEEEEEAEARRWSALMT